MARLWRKANAEVYRLARWWEKAILKARWKFWLAATLLVTAGLAAWAAVLLLQNSTDAPAPVKLSTVLAGIEDERAHFRQIFCAIRNDHGHTLHHDRPCDNALVRLPDEGEAPPVAAPVLARGGPRADLRYLIVPGIFGECLGDMTSPFRYAIRHLEEAHGYVGRFGIVPVGGRKSSAENARIIKEHLEGLEPPLEPGERLVLVGYSKGTTDVLEFLVENADEVEDVAALVSIAGIVAGTPLADGVTSPLKALAEKLPMTSCEPGSGAIDSLNRANAMERLTRGNGLPAGVHYFSMVAWPQKGQVSAILKPSHEILSQTDPRNDSQAIITDAIIPGGTLLGFANADHWAVILPFSQDAPLLAGTLVTRNKYPREVLLEAIVAFVEEALGGGG